MCVGSPCLCSYFSRKDQCIWYVSCQIAGCCVVAFSQNPDSCRPSRLIYSSVTHGPWFLSPCWSLFLRTDCRMSSFSFLCKCMCSWFTLKGKPGDLTVHLKQRKMRQNILDVYDCILEHAVNGCVKLGLLTELSFAGGEESWRNTHWLHWIHLSWEFDLAIAPNKWISKFVQCKFML